MPAWAAHADYLARTDIDFVKIMSDGFFGYPLESEIKTAADWYRLRPLGRRSAYIADQLERVKKVNDRIAAECCTFYTVFAPFSIIRFATSDALVMAHLREDPKAVLHALRIIAEDNAELAVLSICEGGCAGAYIPFQGGETDRFTGDEYAELIAPSDLRVLRAANEASDLNIAHLCAWAGFKNRLEVWKDYPAAAFNWAVHIEDLPLREGREFFKGKAVIGGFDNRRQGVLYSGAGDEIAACAKGILDQKLGDGFLIGADCTLPADIDVSRIRNAVDAVKEYYA